MFPHATGSLSLQNEGLTPKQLAFWHENGYLIIPKALDAGTVDSLLSTIKQTLNDFSLEDHPMTKFTTGGDSGDAHVGDEYFLTSSDKIRVFFEEGAHCPSPVLPLPNLASS